MLVYPDSPEVQSVRHLHTGCRVPPVDRSCESIVDIVRFFYRCVQRAIGVRADYWSEDLLSADRHVLRRIPENCWLEEETSFQTSWPPSSRGKLGSFFFALPDVPFDSFSLFRGDEGAHISSLVERVADLELSGLLSHPAEDLLVDLFVRDDSGHRGAVLAGVPKAADHRALGDRFDFGIAQCDEGCLPTQLQMN